MKPLIQIDYYTDPLCCWSWAFEPVWRRLQWHLGDQLRVRYRMAGLFADTENYHDPLNEINNRGQLATQWITVAQSTGTPISPALWERSPPRSSYPVCVAVKAAESFGEMFLETYLRQLREAAMLDGRDVSQPHVLLAVAADTNLLLAPEHRVDPLALERALKGTSAREAFRQDLRDARYREIGRYPTLLAWSTGPRGLLLTGSRPYESICESLRKLAPELTELMPALSRNGALDQLEDYVRRFRTVTGAEVAQWLGCSVAEARASLEQRGLGDALRGQGIEVGSEQ
jgi:putative protein-disulfide isomerase